jgi:hypothetical protein
MITVISDLGLLRYAGEVELATARGERQPVPEPAPT